MFIRLAACCLLCAAARAFAAATGDVLPPSTGAYVDYAQVQEIFNRRCLECHEGSAAPNGLNLDETRSYNLLVNTESDQVGGLLRVKPGSAEKSYLFQKLNQAQPKSGARMPIGFVLPVEEQVLIRDWIDQGARPLNRLPVFSAPPAAEPAAPRTGEGVRFSATATDPNSDPLTYTWDFGNGTTASGPSVVTSFAAPGPVTVTLTVFDGRNGTRTGSVDLMIAPDSDTDGDGTFDLADSDDDNDGFTDALELALQTDPLNAASTPLGGSTVQPQGLAVAAFSAGFDFKKPQNDKMAAKLAFALPALPESLAQPLTVDLAGVTRSVVLDAKGSAPKSTTQALKLSVKPPKGAGAPNAALSVKLKQDAFAETVLGLLLASQPDASAPLTRTVSVYLNGTVFRAELPAVYTRKKGGSGALKQNRNPL